MGVCVGGCVCTRACGRCLATELVFLEAVRRAVPGPLVGELSIALSKVGTSAGHP